MNKGAQPLPQSIMHQNAGELSALCIQVVLIKSLPPCTAKDGTIFLHLYLVSQTASYCFQSSHLVTSVGP